MKRAKIAAVDSARDINLNHSAEFVTKVSGSNGDVDILVRGTLPVFCSLKAPSKNLEMFLMHQFFYLHR
jgi:hypothetical protein